MIAVLQVFRREQGHLVRVGALSQDVTLEGIVEQHEYLIQVTGKGSRLFVDDAPLTTDALEEYWLWSPGFYAGRVQFELERVGYLEPLHFTADVSPEPNKSGRAQFLNYISQIADYAPEMIVGTEPARYQLGGTSRTRLGYWLRYARLRTFIDDYLKALRSIVERPLVRNRHYREQVPVHLARQVDIATVRQLERNPALLTAIAGGHFHDSEPCLTDDRLDIPFNEPSFDHPANRLITQQLHRILWQVTDLIEWFSLYREKTSETETDIQSRMPRRIVWLSRVRKQLLRFTRQEPFRAVDHHHVDVAAINAIAGLPHYGRGHRLGVRILQEGISGISSDEHHYLVPTWQVYEAWCFVALAVQLEQQLPDYEWQLKSTIRSADLLLSGHKGGSQIHLYTQMVCPSLENPNRYGYYSISRERRPDIVLEYTDVDRTDFVCLDSKYTSHNRGILEAMASAHIYNDAVKHQGKSPVCSLLLVPNNQNTEKLETEQYIENHHVGCITLNNNNDAKKVLYDLLQRLTKH
ncbi:MAG: DUF2357 domain-containing protein [Pseudomonadota bacterium]